VQRLDDEVAAHQRALLQQLQQALDVQHDVAAAAVRVRELMFVERFREQIDQRLEALQP
jgi:molecular chaperone HscB